MRKTDDEIIGTIIQYHALTEKNLEKLLGYKCNTLHSRLRRMVYDGKIKFTRLASKGHTIGMKLFPQYTDISLYYIYKVDLDKWVDERLPREMTAKMRREIAHKFYYIGLTLPKQKNTVKN